MWLQQADSAVREAGWGPDAEVSSQIRPSKVTVVTSFIYFLFSTFY